MYNFQYQQSSNKLSWTLVTNPDIESIEIRWKKRGDEIWTIIYSGKAIDSLTIQLPDIHMEACVNEKPGGGMGIWSDPENVTIIP